MGPIGIKTRENNLRVGKRIHRGLTLVLATLLMTLVLPPVAQATTFTILGRFPTIITTYGVGSIPIVPPTTNSPAPWIFTSSNPRVAAVTGSNLTIIGAGSSTITASQAAIGTYTSRSRSTQLQVSRGTPNIGPFPSHTVPLTQRTFTISLPTSNSDGTWSLTTSDPSIASILGKTVTLLDGGVVTITATQNNTSNWNTARVQMKLTVQAIIPILGPFGNVTIMKDSIASFTLTPPTSTSPAGWTFKSSNTAVATVDRNVVTPHAFGTTTITASQIHLGNYASASTSMILTVQGTQPTLGSFADITAHFTANAPTTLVLQPPTSNSTGNWSFTSSDESIAIVRGLVITLLKPGKTTITGTQSATTVYGSSNPVSMTLTVVGTPALGAWSDIQKVVNDPDFSLTPPTSSSDGTWTFSSSDPSVISVVGNAASVKGAGVAVITATQAATDVWSEAAAHISIQVFGTIPTLGSFAPILGGVGDTSLVITPPTSNSSGSWTFVSSNNKVATVNGNTLSILAPGTAVISATQKPAGLYSQSNTVQTTLTAKPRPTVGNFADIKFTVGLPVPTILVPSSNSSGAWSFISSDPAVLTVIGSKINVVGTGKAIVTATQAAEGDFAAISKTFTVEILKVAVAKPTPTPTPTKKPTVKPTKKPVAKPKVVPTQKPSLRVSLSKRVITVSVIGAKATVKISGRSRKVGKNVVKPGKHKVVVRIAGNVVYSKVFTVK